MGLVGAYRTNEYWLVVRDMGRINMVLTRTMGEKINCHHYGWNLRRIMSSKEYTRRKKFRETGTMPGLTTRTTTSIHIIAMTHGAKL